jgi:uncharacterized protein DUF2325
VQYRKECTVLRTNANLPSHAVDASLDVRRVEVLTRENRTLAWAFTKAQERSVQQQAEAAAALESLQGELMRARAALIAKDTLIATLRAELEPPVPEAQARSRNAGRRILCIGERLEAFNDWREMAQREGGRFEHLAEIEHTSGFDASLAAADMVICQTGCLSHNAHWRVENHCRRHGKRCLFVDRPASSQPRMTIDETGS